MTALAVSDPHKPGSATAAKTLSGPQKSLLFLVSLEESAATRILAQLSDEELRQLRKASSELSEASPQVLQEVHREFAERAGKGVPASLKGSASYLRRLAGKALGEGKIAELWSEKSEQGPVAELSKLDTATILGILELEQPQTIAVILAQFDSGKAVDLLSQMPTDRQTQIVLRMARLQTVPASVIADIEREFAEEIAALGDTSGRNIGGLEAAASLIKRLSAEATEGLLEELGKTDATAAEELRRALFTFEDLVRIDGRGMQVLLKEISTDQLVVALKSASDDIKEKVFGNISTRAAAMLKDELEMLGPVRLSDVEAAQRAIVETAMGLERDRKITIAREGGGEYV
ncbi:MAG: flagellar motor switch protein FliG [Deltaproteobacteria bacterium]|nr:flagellar motor switch protein FliG [Deltaproteobacteria bacterium]